MRQWALLRAAVPSHESDAMARTRKTPKPIAPEWIRWIDSVRLSSDWQPLPQDFEPAVIETVGFVMRETDTSIVVVQNIDNVNGNVSGAMTIPKVAVLKRWKVR